MSHFLIRFTPFCVAKNDDHRVKLLSTQAGLYFTYSWEANAGYILKSN